jgi:hypothetical protein
VEIQQHEFSTVALHSFKLRLGRSELCTIRCEVQSIKHICVVHTQRIVCQALGFDFRQDKSFLSYLFRPEQTWGSPSLLNLPDSNWCHSRECVEPYLNLHHTSSGCHTLVKHKGKYTLTFLPHVLIIY